MKRMSAGLGLSAVVLSLGLSACGSTAATGSSTPISISPTDYITLPPTPTTLATDTTLPNLAGTIIAAESTYVIQANDYPSTIAKKFKVNFNDLMTLNKWTLDAKGIAQGFPGAGATIKIPAGATVPGEPAITAPPATDATGSATSIAGAADTTLPAVTAPPTTKVPPTTINNCAGGSYVIAADDTSRAKVAAKFNVSVASLDAVNAGTKGYKSFYPGLKIVIPAKKAGC